MILRHAKSDRDGRVLRDFDRRLEPRGRHDIALLGEYMGTAGFAPDLVLCSAARRAVETWELLRPRLGTTLQATLRDDLYLADPAHVLDVVRSEAGPASAVLVIGHNPGLGELAAMLATAGEPHALAALRSKFPTAALAVIDFDVDDWSEAWTGELTAFVRPRDLTA